MSSSSLYRVYRTKARYLAEYRNSHGTAPVIWGHLTERFLNKPFSMFDDLTSLWGLARDTRVPRTLRIVHAFCCDDAFCPVDRISELADACEVTYVATLKAGYVNHWQSIADDLRTHKAKSRQIGISLGCTSVCDEWEYYKGSSGFDMMSYIDSKPDTDGGGAK